MLSLFFWEISLEIWIPNSVKIHLRLLWRAFLLLTPLHIKERALCHFWMDLKLMLLIMSSIQCNQLKVKSALYPTNSSNKLSCMLKKYNCTSAALAWSHVVTALISFASNRRWQKKIKICFFYFFFTFFTFFSRDGIFGLFFQQPRCEEKIYVVVTMWEKENNFQVFSISSFFLISKNFVAII